MSVEVRAHAHVLRALAGEHEHHRRRAGVDLAGGALARVLGTERLRCIGAAARHAEAAVGEPLAPRLQRVGHVGKPSARVHPGRRTGFQVLGQVRRSAVQRRGALGRHQQHLLRSRHARGLGRRRLFQHRVGVGATHAERAHARAPRGVGGARPWRQLRDHPKRAVGEVDLRVGRLEVHHRRELLVLQREHGLDQPRHAGRRHQMTEVALGRPQPAKLLVGSARPEGLGEPLDLDGIAQRGGGTVRLHIRDAAGIDPRVGLRERDHRRLAAHAGPGEAHLVRAIVVQGRAADDRVDGVALLQRVPEPLEHHHAHAIAEDGALSPGVERATVAVIREHATLLVQVARPLGHRHGGAARQGHVALEGLQRVHRLADRHQRGGAGGVHADGRSGQPELVGDPRGHIILLVAHHGREGTDALDQVLPVQDVVQVVAVVVDAGVDAHHAREGVGDLPRVLQGVPRGLEKQPLLRVDQLRLLRGDPEEGDVEPVGIVDHAMGPDIAGVGALCCRHLRIDLGLGEERHRLHAAEEVLPVGRDVGRPRKPPRHADDGHRVEGIVPAADTLLGPVEQRGRGLAPFDPKGQPGHRGGLEQAHHRHVDPLLLAQARHELEREQGVAAQLEEVVVHPHPIELDQLSPQGGQGLLQAGGRRHEGLAQLRAPVPRTGQRQAVHLPAGSSRQRVQRHEGRRQHVVRHLVREVPVQIGGEVLDRPVQHHVRHQSAIAGVVLAGDHRDLLHPRVGAEGHFDLAELHSVATDLHLTVDASQKLHGAVGQKPRQVARPIQPRSHLARERIGQEPLSGEVGPVQVASGHAHAAQEQLARLALRHLPELLVDDVEPHPVDGLADGGQRRPGGRRAGQDVGGHHVGLGGTVVVVQTRAR